MEKGFYSLMCHDYDLCSLFATRLFLQRYECGHGHDGNFPVQMLDAMSKLLLAARADATTTKYFNSFMKWKDWATSQGLDNSDSFPAKPFNVAIYLTFLSQKSSSVGALNDAYYCI